MDYSNIEHFDDEQLMTLMDFIQEGVIGLSLEYRITFINSIAAKIFEKSPSNLMGKNFQKLCQKHKISLTLFSQSEQILAGQGLEDRFVCKSPRDHREVYQLYINRHLKGNISKGFVICLKKLAIMKPYDELYFESLKNMAQKVTGQVIDSQSSSEDYAKIMVDYYENILAAMPGNVYWINRDGVYLGCNDNNAAYNPGLTSRDDIVGKTLYDFFEESKAKKLSDINRQVMDADQSKYIEESSPIPGKPDDVYLTQKVPLHDADGNVIGLLGVSFNITDRKKMEKDLKKAKEAAEVANKVKSQFIANMQHDLRTPCAGLLGMMELYAEKEKNSEKREHFHMLSESTRELLNILDNIADINKLELGTIPILDKKFNVHDLLERVIRVDEPMAMYKMLQHRAIVDSEVPDILIGDEYRIHRILLHLVGNAVKFTEKGYVHLRVKVARKKRKGKLIVKFIVEDTGVGIPESEQQRVFEKFVRLTDSNRGLYKGSGLGLSIVKHFVHELGGEIDIESDPKKGTKFIVSLPLQTSILGEEADLVEEDIRF